MTQYKLHNPDSIFVECLISIILKMTPVEKGVLTSLCFLQNISDLEKLAGRLAGWLAARSRHSPELARRRGWQRRCLYSDAVCTATTSKTLPAIPRSLTFQGSTSPPSSNFGPLPVFHYRLHFAISLVNDRCNTQPRLFEIALVESLRSSSEGAI